MTQLVFIILNTVVLCIFLFALIYLIRFIWKCKHKSNRQVSIREPVNERALNREETFYLTAPSSEVNVPQRSVRDSFVSAESMTANQPCRLQYDESFILT